MDTRQIRGDQIEVFTIMHGQAAIDKETYLKLKDNLITRWHINVLIKNHGRLDVRKCAFLHRVVYLWKKVPASRVNAANAGYINLCLNNE